MTSLIILLIEMAEEFARRRIFGHDNKHNEWWVSLKSKLSLSLDFKLSKLRMRL